MRTLANCPVCGKNEFTSSDVLWQELIDAWKLSSAEVEYINRQQGYFCKNCNNNMRSMGLAAAIMEEYSFQGSFLEFCITHPQFAVLEINPAGNLTQFLKYLPGHTIIEYPEFDMQNLSFPDEHFDLVIHSDTLEHVPNPVQGLSECRRVLRSRGKCIFTVPIIVNRMSRLRVGLKPSYHGQSGLDAFDQLVHTEFGADVWKFVAEAGFKSCAMYSFEYPSSIALIAKK